MKRWDEEQSCNVESEKIDEFLLEIMQVCKKHNLTIAHEDYHGAFIIEGESESNLEWINNAHIGESVK